MYFLIRCMQFISNLITMVGSQVEYEYQGARLKGQTVVLPKCNTHTCWMKMHCKKKYF